MTITSTEALLASDTATTAIVLALRGPLPVSCRPVTETQLLATIIAVLQAADYPITRDILVETALSRLPVPAEARDTCRHWLRLALFRPEYFKAGVHVIPPDTTAATAAEGADEAKWCYDCQQDQRPPAAKTHPTNLHDRLLFG